MKKITAIEIAILFIAGLVPLLWLNEGFIISKGDDFPLFLNPQQSFRTGVYLWSPNFLGYATPTPAYALYQYSAVFLSYLGLSVGSVQIFFQVFLFMLAGFSMYYFSKTVYPTVKLAGFAAGFFYMFNFFALDNRQNIGFVWTYAFLPLLLALFVKVINATFQRDKKTANKNIIYFALVSIVAFSFASINPANLALMLFGIAILVVYYLVKFRKQLRPLLASFGKIAGLAVPINLWWIIPILNFYFLSSQTFNSTVSVGAWSWTHARASFLNLFWLNGFWGWLPEYVPYIGSYSNPVLIILVFAPFIVAASALLFKGEKSRFNAYIMGSILVLLFLAKGLHEPFRDLNLLLYNNISLMSMFREPASKFTLLIVPFLALLIGYAVGNFANVTKLKIRRFYFRVNKILVVSLVLVVFVAAVYPLIINPLETSSYVQIPDYWYQATNWINSQQGDWKVLITPLDDYYQMNYTWGYYGTDQLIESLFEKPIVTTSSLDGYKINNDTAFNLKELKSSIRGNRSSEFRAMLDLLNIKYIFQRNDVQNGMTNRYLMSAFEMQSFLSKQPYLLLVQKFGSIDIYEYAESKPSLYTLSPSSLEQTDIKIENISALDKEWNFAFIKDVAEWQNSTLLNQSQSTCEVKQIGTYLEAEEWNSVSGWITVDSPPLPAQYDTEYTLRVPVAGMNTSDVQIQIAEYHADGSITTNASMIKVGGGNFTTENISFPFELKSPETQCFSIQIWNYFNSNETTRSILWLGNVEVTGQTYTLHIDGLENLFVNQTANILEVQKTSPIKTAVTVNATEPFILATSQALDKFWVAYVDGERVKPVSLFLGLQGFPINETGQFDVTIEYEPQLWFYYASAISISATAAICALYMYINRDRIKGIFKNTNKQKGDAD